MSSRVPGSSRVRYYGFFFGSTGYHVEARAVVRYLYEAGYDLELRPVAGSARSPKALDAVTRGLIEALLARSALPARPVAQIHHVPADLIRPDPAIPVAVGRTMVETDRLPAGWAEACRRLDEVWVPSSFNAAVFREAGLDPARIRVVPVGVDTRVFCPDARGRLPEALKAPGFKFLSVFAWQRRKGWDVLVQAYLEEFPGERNVTLVLKTQPWFFTPSQTRAQLEGFIHRLTWLDPVRLPSVVLISSAIGEADMAALYAACDAFVLPSRGEGLGRPYLEAMATGMPTIGTNWGGNLDFMNGTNSYLVDIEGLEPMVLTGPGAGHNDETSRRWARPSVSHLRKLMRQVYENPAEGRARGLVARRDVTARWDYRVTCQALARELDKFL